MHEWSINTGIVLDLLFIYFQNIIYITIFILNYIYILTIYLYNIHNTKNFCFKKTFALLSDGEEQ